MEDFSAREQIQKLLLTGDNPATAAADTTIPISRFLMHAACRPAAS